MKNAQNNSIKGNKPNCNGYRISNVINGDNLNNGMCEASRNFRNKKKKYMKHKITELTTNSKNKNIRDLYRGVMKIKVLPT
jgi:hypothetical protein